MPKHLKHQLPACSILDHLCLDEITLTELRNCLSKLNGRFVSVFEVNKELCGIHHSLASKVYDSFFQIALTEPEVCTETTIEDCKVLASKINQRSITKSVRLKKELSNSLNSSFNELSYTKKSKVYEEFQPLFDKILNPLKSRPTRIRLVRLAAGATVPPHIDYDPSYGVRVIIPIVSSPECLNLFWVKNNSQSFHLEPGKAYFLNTGYKHAVVNLSDKDRFTFMITVDGTEDICHLIKD